MRFSTTWSLTKFKQISWVKQIVAHHFDFLPLQMDAAPTKLHD